MKTEKTEFKTTDLVVRKAAWLAQKHFPFITEADIVDAAEELISLGEGEPGTSAPILTARDLADFTCDIVKGI